MTISTLILFLFGVLLIGRATSANNVNCKPIPITTPYNIDEISKRTWYETWISPKGGKKCVVRNYDPSANSLRWMEKESSTGSILSAKTLPFIQQGDVQLLKEDGSIYQQFLATDSESWMLLNICDKADAISRLVVAFNRPTRRLPPDVHSQIRAVLTESGLGERRFFLSKCSPPI